MLIVSSTPLNCSWFPALDLLQHWKQTTFQRSLLSRVLARTYGYVPRLLRVQYSSRLAKQLPTGPSLLPHSSKNKCNKQLSTPKQPGLCSRSRSKLPQGPNRPPSQHQRRPRRLGESPRTKSQPTQPSTTAQLAELPSDWPEIECLPIDTAVHPAGAAPTDDFIALGGALLTHIPRDNVTMTSTDTSIKPLRNPNWLSERADQEVAVLAFRRIREIAAYSGIEEVAPSGENLLYQSLIFLEY